MTVVFFLPSPLSDRQAFDQHLNMVLGDVEESVTTRELDEETEEEIVKVRLHHVSPHYLSPSTYISTTSSIIIH